MVNGGFQLQLNAVESSTESFDCIPFHILRLYILSDILYTLHLIVVSPAQQNTTHLIQDIRRRKEKEE